MWEGSKTARQNTAPHGDDFYVVHPGPDFGRRYSHESRTDPADHNPVSIPSLPVTGPARRPHLPRQLTMAETILGMAIPFDIVIADLLLYTSTTVVYKRAVLAVNCRCVEGAARVGVVDVGHVAAAVSCRHPSDYSEELLIYAAAHVLELSRGCLQLETGLRLNSPAA
jgi:hypothetical protein